MNFHINKGNIKAIICTPIFSCQRRNTFKNKLLIAYFQVQARNTPVVCLHHQSYRHFRKGNKPRFYFQGKETIFNPIFFQQLTVLLLRKFEQGQGKRCRNRYK